MFKAIILLSRKPGTTRDEFREWWLGSHATLARQLPGLRGLRFNLVTSEGGEIDGVSELLFDSQEAFETAYASEIGKAVAADSLANVGRRERLLVDEREIL